MKKIFLITLILFIGFAGFIFLRPSPSPSSQEKKVVAKEISKPTIDPSKKKPDAKKKVQVKKKVKKASPTQPKQPNFIPPSDEHQAIIDDQGSIYPQSVFVDGDDVIAYGDVIVGNAYYLDRYQSGEEPLKISKPSPWTLESIPYYLKKDLPDEQKEVIKDVLRTIQEESKIKFHPKEIQDNDYISFEVGEQNCYSQVGYIKDSGPHKVRLSANCKAPQIFHEVFHALGFFHEQNRYDRDDHLSILWENIDEQYWGQFERFSEASYPEELTSSDDFHFSFKTIMIYDSNSFSTNDDYSMVTIDGLPILNTPEEPTEVDYTRLKLLYFPNSY